MMQKIRVVVIDDSAFMRKMISDILNSDSRIEVIATARNGQDGVKKIKDLSPDAVTLDVNMPIMNGIDALQQIMETCPVPVVMLSSDTQEGATKTIQAISNGAVDFITKPSGAISLDIQKITQEIISKVLAASQVNLKQEPILKKPVENVTISSSKNFDRTLVAIGTSTGGPRALQTVMTSLPKNFTAPILIVQHMPPGFTKSLADRLNTVSPIHVKEAVHGEIIKERTAYIAPGDYHMTIKKVGRSLAICLTEDPPVKGHRPSVDVMFSSVATVQQYNKIAVVLTGMGNDGSAGLIKIKNVDREAVIIAESDETAIVYGMPKAAAQTEKINYIVPLYEVSNMLAKLTN